MLNDKEILIRAYQQSMIHPVMDTLVREEKEVGRLSYGISSFGYDVRLAETVQIFSDINGVILDPKRPDTSNLVTLKVHEDVDTGEQYVIMPPHTYALGHTVESFNIPKDVSVGVLGKSTYARSGLIVNVTPIEAGFSGQVVIEIANTVNLPCKVYINEGIAQFQFHEGNPCSVSYGERAGKYQDQRGITLGKV